MNTEQVNKSIRQMRQMFGFFGILTALGTVLALIGSMSDASNFIVVIIEGAFAACFWTAFNGLGKRNPTGFTFARICSVLFLLGFPVLTIFGIIYLNKLSKPEMKQALGAL